MAKKIVLKRLKQLYLLELFNVFWLPICFWFICYLNKRPMGQNVIVAMILNGIMLLEGSYFWWCTMRKLKFGSISNYITLFRKLRIINLPLFVASLICILTTPFKNNFDLVGTLLFFSLAVLEHINYFEFQLIYDNENDKQYLKRYKKLKVSKLKQQLLEIKSTNNT